MSYSGQGLGTVQQDSSSCYTLGWPGTKTCDGLGPEWQFVSQNGLNSGNCGPFAAASNCQKKQYLGDVGSCCLGNQPTGYPKYTCDPSLNETTTPCQTAFQGYCSTGNITTDKKCTKWADNNLYSTVNGPAINALMSTYCTPGRMGTDSRCRTWALMNMGKVDSTMMTFCAANPKDPMCTCINSPVAGAVCPLMDSSCKSTGYETAAMMTQSCNLVDCRQIINMNPSQYALIAGNTIVQKCNQTVTSGTSNVTSNVTSNGTSDGTSSGTTVNPTTPVVPPVSNTTTSTKSIMYLLIFIFILICIAYVYNSDTSSSNYVSSTSSSKPT